MTHTDDIDERRCRAMAALEWPGEAGRRPRMLDVDVCMDIARAIRESDEAAGYILIKHEGVISSEGMKPVTR